MNYGTRLVEYNAGETKVSLPPGSVALSVMGEMGFSAGVILWKVPTGPLLLRIFGGTVEKDVEAEEYTVLCVGVGGEIPLEGATFVGVDKTQPDWPQAVFVRYPPSYTRFPL